MDINNYNNYRSNTYFNNGSLNPNFSVNERGNQYNYNNAFQQNQPLIDQPQNTNLKNTLHNNLNNNLLAEHIVEYYINIDSDDRKMDVYPNPYNYVVSFKPLGKSIDRKNKFKGDSENIGGEIFYDETPAPIIVRNFKNVKYVKLDRVILSRHLFIKFVIDQDIFIEEMYDIESNSDSDSEYNSNSNLNNEQNDKKTEGYNVTVSSVIDRKISKKKNIKLTNSYIHGSDECETIELCDVCCSEDCNCILSDTTKYVLLKVKELETRHIYSTNTLTSDNSFVLYIDKTLGTNNNIWFATYGSCIYPSSLLSNIDRLTIEFYDKKGDIITPKIIVEYNVTVHYKSKQFHQIYCLLFGKFDNTALHKIKKRYSNIINLKFSDFCKPELWCDKVFYEITKKNKYTKDSKIVDVLNRTAFVYNNKKKHKETCVENYIKILESIENLDLCEKIKCMSNNVFFIIGIVQNELNTMTKFER